MNGAISGLAATGGNQIFKQAVKLICERRGVDYKQVEPVVDVIDETLKYNEKSKSNFK